MEPKSYDAIFGDAWHVQGSAIRKRFTYLELNTSPLALVTPEFIGQVAFDEVGKVFYTSIGLTSNDWTSGANNEPFASKADAAGTAIAAAVKSIRLQFYAPVFATPSTLNGGGVWERMSKADIDALGLPARTYFRSVDRGMPNGTTDALNGGYWALSAAQKVNVEMIGGPNDGVTDCAPYWGDILTFCGKTGAKYESMFGKTYMFSTRAGVSRVPTDHDLEIDICGSKLICDGLGGLSIIGADVPFLTTTLAAEPARGDPLLNLTSVAGIEKGDYIEILSPALSQNAIGVYHYYPVSELDGNNVYIEGTVVADINAQQIIDDGKVGAISVRVYKLVGKCVFRNGEIVAVNPLGLPTASSLYFRNLAHLLIDNSVLDGHTRNQITIQSCAYYTVRDLSAKEFGYVIKDQGYVNLPSHPDSAGYGYGIVTNRCFHGFVSRCRGGRGWHLIDASRGSMHTTIENCFLLRDSFGLSCHEGAWYLNVIGCEFDGGDGIQGTRCAYLTVKGSKFRNLRNQGITYAGLLANVEVRIHDCDLDTGWGEGSTDQAIYNAAAGDANAGAMSVGWDRVFELKNNTIDGVARVYGGLGGVDPGRLVIRDNDLSNGAIFYSIQPMTENDVRDNTFGDINGQYAMQLSFSSAIVSHITLDNNKQAGAWSAFTNSALIYISGSGTHDINLYGNKSEGQFMVRFTSTDIGIDYCVGNVNKLGRMFLGAATNTVAKAYRNDFVGSVIQTGGVVITDQEGNYSPSHKGSAVYDPASLADGAGVTTTVPVVAAALGDIAIATFSLDLQGVGLSAWVSAAGTVSVRFQNETGGVVDLGSGTIKAVVRKF